MSETDLWQLVLYLHVLAMAFFVGGQILIGAVVVPVERTSPDPERLRGIALTLVHLRYPRAHVLQAAILVATLAIVWLGLDLP